MPSLKATFTIFLGISQRICFKKVFFSSLAFQAQGYNFDITILVNVYDLNITQFFFIIPQVLYICVWVFHILYGIKYMISYHILVCNSSKCNCVVPPTPNSFPCTPFVISPLIDFCFENLFDINFHHHQLLKPSQLTYQFGLI